MSIFLSSEEEYLIRKNNNIPFLNLFLNSLAFRVEERLFGNTDYLNEKDPLWWYSTFEYLSDAAMLYRLEQDESVGSWLHKMVLKISDKQEEEWIGPEFRDHSLPYIGNLETAHLCWGIGSVLDLCPDIFSKKELENIQQSLLHKGIFLCEAWLKNNNHLANWRGIMASGGLVASIILGRKDKIDFFLREIGLTTNAFQSDGSYGESLQYANYLAFSIMISYEALNRYDQPLTKNINISAYGNLIKWFVNSYLFSRPVSGWGDEPRANSVNFNDSAVLFRPSGDLLLHLSARFRNLDENISGLSHYFFERLYVQSPSQTPHNLATFGMYNDWGFLTLPLLTYSFSNYSPGELNMPMTKAFSNGNVFIRDKWKGKLMLAIQAGPEEGLNAVGHVHGDLNSFIISYNKEHLLIDPGHSCYRNIIHGLESSSQSHNTCTFLLKKDELNLQEDFLKENLIEQRNILKRRLFTNGNLEPSIKRQGRLLACHRMNDISVIRAEAGEAYNSSIKLFYRTWLQIGSNITLVWDQILAENPVLTIWNWVLNMRDPRNHIVQMREEVQLLTNRAGLKLVNLGKGKLVGPVYGFAHDAYNPLPNQRGEGKLGSAEIFRFMAEEYQKEISNLHILISDDAMNIGAWEVINNDSIDIINKRHKYNVGILRRDSPNHSTFIIRENKKEINVKIFIDNKISITNE